MDLSLVKQLVVLVVLLLQVQTEPQLEPYLVMIWMVAVLAFGLELELVKQLTAAVVVVTVLLQVGPRIQLST